MKVVLSLFGFVLLTICSPTSARADLVVLGSTDQLDSGGGGTILNLRQIPCSNLFFGGFSLLLLLINCPDDNFNQTSKNAAAKQARLNQEFTMKVGEDVAFRGEDLEIRFLSVVEDSRCPKSEQCITEGNAKIELQLKRSQRPQVTIELNTSSGAQKASYEGYDVKLVGLEPYPNVGGSIKPSDYVVTVLVSKTLLRACRDDL